MTLEIVLDSLLGQVIGFLLLGRVLAADDKAL